MYGPGIVPPQPRPAGRAGLIWLRVLFTALPMLSLGFLAWGSLLRLAVVRRHSLDWALMVIDIVAIIVGYTLVGLAHDNTDTWQSNAGTLTVLVVMFGTPAYYLVRDVRRKDARPAGYALPTGYPPNPYATGYGPMPGPPHAGPAYGGIPRPAPMQPRSPMPMQTPMPTQTPAPAQPPAPDGSPAPRINQVRAELDELSNYLRKEEGR